jgi:hypothetical protein
MQFRDRDSAIPDATSCTLHFSLISQIRIIFFPSLFVPFIASSYRRAP